VSELVAVRPRLARRAVPARADARRVQGERLAIGSAATAVALLPLLIPGGPSNMAPVDLPIAIAIGASMYWAGLAGHRWRFPYVAPIALLLAGGAIGALRGPLPGTGATALVQDVILLLWCWCLANVASSPERMRTIARTWAYSSIAWATLLFLGLATGTTAITGQTAREGSRTALTFVDPNISANYYFLSLMVVWATGCPQRPSLRRLAYVLLLAAIFTTGSSGALMSVLVGVAVAALIGMYRRSGLVPAITVGALGLLAFALVHSQLSMTGIQNKAAGSKYAFLRDGLGRGQQSEEFRSALLQESSGLYVTSGALGAGPVTTKVRLDRAQEPVVKEAHDDYLAAILERGVVGFTGLLLLIATVATRAVSVATGRLKPAFAEVIVRPHALVGALAGTFTAAAVYEVLHVRHVWALFALVAALSIWGRE
jgi:hypothetical protein